MGCHILADHYRKQAVLYCSTTDWAFGPVFNEDDGHDAEERAEAFLRWLDTTDAWSQFEKEPLQSGRRDARILTERGLQTAYSAWLAQEATQWAESEAAAVFAEEEEEARRNGRR